MKLTEKDKLFLEKLKLIIDANEVSVDLKRGPAGPPGYMVLRGIYGEGMNRHFRMTRQGVRWRFWRIFNDMYVSAFETILFIETTFGTGLRDYAIRISQERYAQRQRCARDDFQSADRIVEDHGASEPARP